MMLGQLAFPLAICLFVLIGFCLELGYRLGRSRAQQNPQSAHEGINALEAAVYGLLGLLLAFSFSGGISRFEVKRQLIVQEANAIDVAYLRLDLLPAANQPEMRQQFRDYLDARLGVYQKIPDMKAAEQELARCRKIQEDIWSRAVRASRDDSTQNAARLLLPALNEMIDITT